MLLQRLAEYSEHIPSTPPFYIKSPVRYIIELDLNGNLLKPSPIDTSTPEFRRGKILIVPGIYRSNNIKPLLLADNAEYTLGLPRKPERDKEYHKAYLAVLERCWDETEEENVKAVLTFLKNDPLGKLELPEDFDRNAFITFQVEGKRVVDLPGVRTFWAGFNDPASQSGTQKGQCHICGQNKPVLERLTGRIKGIPGGQMGGTVLISANSPAFESYGLEASLVAPTCASCAENFTKATNYLLGSPKHRLVLGGSIYIFWTPGESSFYPAEFLNTPEPDQVSKLIGESTSQKASSIPFYVAGFSSSNSRAVVRDWLESTEGQVKANLIRWFELQKITGTLGEEPYSKGNLPLGLFTLAGGITRHPAQDQFSATVSILVRAALVGTPLPLKLLQMVLAQIRTEGNVTRPRATLIKLFLASRADELVTLEPDRPEPAYHLGRILYILENAQKRAISGLKSTMVERFYGMALVTPASIFPLLFEKLEGHLGELRLHNQGVYHAIRKHLEEVLIKIDPSFPELLTLEEQCFFALGYYFERARAFSIISALKPE